MQTGWDLSGFYRHRRLDETSHTGCTLGVPNIGFDRTNTNGFGAAGSKYRAKRLKFDRVALPCASAMSFDISNRRGGEIGID